MLLREESNCDGENIFLSVACSLSCQLIKHGVRWDDTLERPIVLRSKDSILEIKQSNIKVFTILSSITFLSINTLFKIPIVYIQETIVLQSVGVFKPGPQIYC